MSDILDFLHQTKISLCLCKTGFPKLFQKAPFIEIKKAMAPSKKITQKTTVENI